MPRLLRAGAFVSLIVLAICMGQASAEATPPYAVYLPLVALNASDQPAPPSPTATSVRTLTPTRTRTVTRTATATWTATSPATDTATATATTTGTRTVTPATSTPTRTATVPSNGCPSIPAETYTAISVNPPPTDRPAAQHADLNLALRGYVPTGGYLGLIDLTGATDTRAPQLYGLFGDQRTGVFTVNLQVYDWNWSTNSRGPLLTYPPVTLSALAVSSGEAIHVPNSGYSIGTATLVPPPNQVFLRTEALDAGYQVLVLYAATDRITLKYTRDDNVVVGYTLHVENICVEPRLQALYNQMNAAGRGNLPALRGGQSFASASSTQIGVAIRDSGTFMDPRSRKDWWQGR